jgi:hypothetical protein
MPEDLRKELGDLEKSNVFAYARTSAMTKLIQGNKTNMSVSI